MGTEQTKDSDRDMEWKNLGKSDSKEAAGTGETVKKRLPKRIRQIPDCYFLPRRSLPYNLVFFGSCIAGGIGAGMLLEIWMKKKIKGNTHATANVTLQQTAIYRMEVSSGNLTNKETGLFRMSLSAASSAIRKAPNFLMLEDLFSGVFFCFMVLFCLLIRW